MKVIDLITGRLSSKISLVFFIVLFATMPGISAYANDNAAKNDLQEAKTAAEKICMNLKPFMERSDKLREVRIDPSEEINAYADQKNNITFFMGMMNFVRDENELAVVCAHELAHITAQHIKRSIFTQVLSGVAQEAIGGTIGNVAGAALATKQSRKHEREADSRGLLCMWQAGYDPRSAWKFWNAMANRYKQGDSKIQKYFGTHPVDSERIENFQVLLVRYCKESPSLKYCDEIMADQNLVDIYNQFESR